MVGQAGSRDADVFSAGWCSRSVGAVGDGVGRETAVPPQALARGRRIRNWGVVLALGTLTEGALGVASAAAPGSAPSTLFFVHVALGVGLVATAATAYALLRDAGGWARVFALLTSLATAGAGTTGAIFFVTGFAQGAVIDRGLAAFALLSAIALALVGTSRTRSAEAR